MTSTPLHYATIWEQIADRIPGRPALRHGDRVVSWREFDTHASLVAGALLEHGIGVEDSVGLCLFNRPEYFEAFFGAIKVRARPFNVNYRYGGEELRRLLETAGAKALVYDAALRDQVAAAVTRVDDLQLLVEVGGDGSTPLPHAHRYGDLLVSSTAAPRIARAEGDTYLNFTGGTTGLPKGVLVQISRSTANALWFRDLFLGVTTDLDPADFAVQRATGPEPMSAIPASPVMHGAGFMYSSLPTLTSGGTVTTLATRPFDADELLRTVADTDSQVVAIVGDAFALPIVRALDASRRDGHPYDTTSLRLICSAGVAWSEQIKARLLDHIPQVTLFDACGSTEGVSYGVRQVRRGDSLSTANFDAAPGLKVLSLDGVELPPGEIGFLAGPAHGTGYFREPEKSAQTFMVIDGDQYAMPGDLGRIETDGTITLIGRGVTTINTGGEKVYPNEVEEVVKGMPGVDDCLVLGVPDERFGQRVAALVVLAPGHHFEAADVSDAVRAALAGYKVPRQVRFVDQLPRTPNGKIDYPAATGIVSPA